jgi:hypothetical protein
LLLLPMLLFRCVVKPEPQVCPVGCITPNLKPLKPRTACCAVCVVCASRNVHSVPRQLRHVHRSGRQRVPELQGPRPRLAHACVR